MVDSCECEKTFGIGNHTTQCKAKKEETGKGSDDPEITFGDFGNTINVVSPKIQPPPFNGEYTDSWLRAMDFWFTASNIQADNQKFSTIMSHLPPDSMYRILEQITDQIPERNKYDFIRSHVSKYFADSQQRRLNRVLNELPLGDSKPSQLFSEMKRVAGNTLSGEALKNLWIQRLPVNVRPALVASQGDEPEMTRIADAVVEALQFPSINSVQSSVPVSSSSSMNPEINELRSEIQQLTKKFEKMFSNRSRSHSRSHSRNRSNSRHQNRSNTPVPDECWYHRKHGENARHCRSPCKYHKSSKTK